VCTLKITHTYNNNNTATKRKNVFLRLWEISDDISNAISNYYSITHSYLVAYVYHEKVVKNKSSGLNVENVPISVVYHGCYIIQTHARAYTTRTHTHLILYYNSPLSRLVFFFPTTQTSRLAAKLYCRRLSASGLHSWRYDGLRE